jgi:amino acid adenylation domain-containing protein
MKLPPDQEGIRSRCFHPAGQFVEFPVRDVETTIPERFEKIARQYPDRLAIEDGKLSLTYSELDEAANHVAHVIIERCGDTLNPVLTLVDHGPQAIISCLGVLKAGKIMLAVDPSFPAKRLNFIAQDSRAEAILAYGDDFQLATHLADRDRPAINLDAIGSARSSIQPRVKRSPADPAVLGYTSGSTGRPKGVLRNHRRSLSAYRSLINTCAICPEDRVIILRRLSFNTNDTFSPLMAGAAAFPFDIKLRNFRDLADFLCVEEITHFVATPSIFRYFAQELKEGEKIPSIRIIKLGGEPLFRADVDYYKRHFSPNCVLLNQLSGNEMGPVCQYWLTQETEIASALVPVGYPLEGKKVFLLNEEKGEVRTGQIGEIAVASRYLSSGYWNNDDLTGDRFLPGKAADEALYLSGDLGRKLSDGCLIYIGREDDQVKIRGAKVEISEIEAVLLEHPKIKHSAIVALDRPNGDIYLTAYVVSRCQPPPTVTDLNGHVRERLPEYMVPSVYMFLESLPFTNGKLDRKALPKPEGRRPALRTIYASPKNEVEKNWYRFGKPFLIFVRWALTITFSISEGTLSERPELSLA